VDRRRNIFCIWADYIKKMVDAAEALIAEVDARAEAAEKAQEAGEGQGSEGQAAA
jgi:hypothetical protein